MFARIVSFVGVLISLFMFLIVSRFAWLFAHRLEFVGALACLPLFLLRFKEEEHDRPLTLWEHARKPAFGQARRHPEGESERVAEAYGASLVLGK